MIFKTLSTSINIIDFLQNSNRKDKVNSVSAYLVNGGKEEHVTKSIGNQ